MLLDTLQMRRRMREAGFPEEQADVVTEGIANIVAGELATKEDLRELRTEMLDKFAEVRGEIAELRGEVKGEIAELKGEIAEVRAELKGEIAELKGEIAEVRGELKGEIAELKNTVADLKVSIADFKTSMAKWVVGLVMAMMLGFAGMTVALLVTLVRIFG